MKTVNKVITLGVCVGAAYLFYKAAEEAITRVLVANALDRESPSVMTKMEPIIKGKRKPDPLKEYILSECDRLEKTDFERVTVTAKDGTLLAGRYYPAEEPKRMIVAMHGWRGTWASGFGALFEFFHDNGCSVLYVDQRGQGESGGDYMGFGTLENYDCLTWVNWLNERNGTDLPVYLIGVSMGATSVLMCEELDMPENVHGIIADCGFTSANEIWKHVVEKNLHISYKKREKRANELCRQRLGRNADSYSTVDALSKGNIPVLFIHGGDDTFVPVDMTFENFRACKAPKRLLIIPGAPHARSSWIEPEKYENELLAFWKDFDDCKPGELKNEENPTFDNNQTQE